MTSIILGKKFEDSHPHPFITSFKIDKPMEFNYELDTENLSFKVIWSIHISRLPLVVKPEKQCK